MRLTNTGNLGIGTSSPANRLDVRGTAAGGEISITIANSSATGFEGVTFSDSTNAKGQIWVGNGSYASFGGAGSINYSANSGPHVWYTNYTERMRIDSTGNLGIGTSSPGALLDVAGNTQIASTGALTSAALANAVGYKGLPQNSQTASYTLVLADMGKHISITTGGIVIPANGTTAFPVGTTIIVYNNSGSSQLVTISTDTLRQAGTSNTGTRNLAGYGLATLVKVGTTVWVISGAGVS
jgi:hypothetical protein